MRRQADEAIDIVKTRGRLRRTRTTLARFDVPLKIQRAPMKARGFRIDHGRLLPSGQKFLRIHVWELCLKNFRKAIIAHIWIVPESAPHHPVIPVLDYFNFSGRFRLFHEKFSTPYITVRAIIKSLRYIVGNICYKLPDKIGGSPTEIVNIIVSQGPDCFLTCHMIREIHVIGLCRCTIYMGLGIFKAENEVYIRI